MQSNLVTNGLVTILQDMNNGCLLTIIGRIRFQAPSIKRAERF